MPQNLRAHLALLAVAFIYGANYSIAKIAMNDGYLRPFGFIALRGLVGFILFWTIQTLLVREKIDRRDLPRLALCGLFGIAMNQLFFFAGLNLTTPINASLIMTTTPILVLVASSFLLSEKITFRKVTGIIIGATGAVLLIAYGKRIHLGGQGILGDLMIMVNASSFGIYLVISKPLMKKYHPITVVKWAFAFGLLMILPFGLPPLLQTQWATFTPDVWLSVVYVLVCTTFFAYLLNAYALKIVQASVVSIYIYLQPLIATAIALTIGADHLDGIKAVAGSLIFFGVYLVSFRKKQPNSLSNVSVSKKAN